MTAIILQLVVLVGAPATSTAPDPKLTELVKQLGAKSYRVREQAALQLLRRGSESVAVLTAGLQDIDPEVSERCRQLLPQAAGLERNQKIAKFLEEHASPPPKGLAGVERFLKIVGDTKETREMYAQLLTFHHETLELAETNPPKALEKYRQFCDEAYNRWQAGARTGRYSYDNLFTTPADVTYFLFVSADKRLRKDENTAAANRAQILLNGTQITKAIGDKENSPTRRLFVDWLENEPSLYMQQRGIQIAMNGSMKEALPIALKILDRKDNQTPYYKAQILVSLAKLGTKEHIKKLEPHLADKTNVGNVNFGQGQMTIEMRDVALGVAVQLAGQKIGDFGFDTRFGGGQVVTSYHYFGFLDEKSRESAHSKWKEWVAKNPLDAPAKDKDGKMLVDPPKK